MSTPTTFNSANFLTKSELVAAAQNKKFDALLDTVMKAILDKYDTSTNDLYCKLQYSADDAPIVNRLVGFLRIHGYTVDVCRREYTTGARFDIQVT